MKQFTYTIKAENGIHARPAGLLVKEAQKYESEITVNYGEKSASLKKLLALMGLGIKQGGEIVVRAEGKDEEAAVVFLKGFIESNF